jgi:hypothetical protein
MEDVEAFRESIEQELDGTLPTVRLDPLLKKVPFPAPALWGDVEPVPGQFFDPQSVRGDDGLCDSSPETTPRK